MKHMPHIDGLRALAVLPVLLFHFNDTLAPGGFAGVDVFFVISGYLITGIIWDGLKDGTFSLAKFYERRARRILPALFAVCFLSIILALLLFMPQDYRDFSKSLEGVAGFASNFIFARNTGYFAEHLSVKPLLHTWSLSVEEQFYVLFPLLLLALGRGTKRAAAGAVFLLLAVSLALNLAFIDARPEKTFYLLHTRAWELLAGAALRLFLQDIRLPKGVPGVLGAAGLAFLLAGYGLYDRETPFPGIAAVPPCLAAMLLIWCGLGGQKNAAQKFLSARPLVYIGLISYGLYLYHWPLLVFARYYLDRAPNGGETMLLIAASFVLAVLSHRFIEQPVRTGAALKSRRGVFAFSISGLLLLGAAGYLGVVSNGLPARFSERALNYAAQSADTNRAFAACLPGDPGSLSAETLCRIGAKKKNPDFMVWGDSHLAALEPAVSAMAEKHGKAAVAVAYSGCPPLLGADRADNYVDFSCPAIASMVLEIIKSEKIKTVLLVTRWDMYAEGWEEGSVETARAPFISFTDENGETLKGRAAFKASFDKTAEALRALGVKVWVVGQVPPHLAHVPTALAKTAYLGRDPALLRRPLSEVRERLSFVNETFMERRDIALIDPAKTFCPGGACLVEADGRVLYSDNNHLTVTGALWAQDMLAPFFED